MTFNSPHHALAWLTQKGWVVSVAQHHECLEVCPVRWREVWEVELDQWFNDITSTSVYSLRAAILTMKGAGWDVIHPAYVAYEERGGPGGHWVVMLS